MSKKTELDAIKRKINQNLTGDFEKDHFSLLKKLSDFTRNPLYDEVRMMSVCLLSSRRFEDESEGNPSDKKSGKFYKDLQKALFYFFADKFDKALPLCEGLVQSIEKNNLYRDTNKQVFRFFSEPYEELLYRDRYKSKRELVQIPVPYPLVYLLYGKVLNALDRPEQARAALKKGLAWNPVDFPLTIEQIHTYEISGDWEKVRELALAALQIAGYRICLSQCYHKLGAFFEQKGKMDAAYACYGIASVDAGPDSPVHDDLDRVTAKQSWSFANLLHGPNVDRAMKKYKIPEPIDDDTIDPILQWFSEAMEQQRFRRARYLLDIAYDLTESDELAGVIRHFEKRFGDGATLADDEKSPTGKNIGGKKPQHASDSIFEGIVTDLENALPADVFEDVLLPYEKEMNPHSIRSAEAENAACALAVQVWNEFCPDGEFCELRDDWDRKLLKQIPRLGEYVTSLDFPKALEFSERMIREIEKSNKYNDSAECVCRHFNSPLELALWQLHCGSEKELFLVGSHFGIAYFLRATAFLCSGRYEEARQTAEKGLRWSPMFFDLNMMYVETFKTLGDWENFANLTRKAFHIACLPEDLKTCYQNLADYYRQKGDDKKAALCADKSEEWEKIARNSDRVFQSKGRKKSRKANCGKTAEPYRVPSLTPAERKLQKDGIPPKPASLVIAMGVLLASAALDVFDMRMMKETYKTVYNLTQDDEIFGVIEQIEELGDIEPDSFYGDDLGFGGK